jgi:hypothetical protein
MNAAASSCAVMSPSRIWLLCAGLVGFILGLAFVLLVFYIDRHLRALEARWRHRADEEAASAQLELQRVIDAEIDERLGCSVCWEDRYPGRCYPLAGSRLCSSHSRQRVLEKNSSAHMNQQQPINHFVNKALAVEEICA